MRPSLLLKALSKEKTPIVFEPMEHSVSKIKLKGVVL